jgi:hypothetical protein
MRYLTVTLGNRRASYVLLASDPPSRFAFFVRATAARWGVSPLAVDFTVAPAGR